MSTADLDSDERDANPLVALEREAERDRCKAIMTSEYAELRDRLAKHLALATDIPAPEALSILRAAPVDAAVTDRMQ